ncbi:hypothetical protein PoB_006164400 [Plakobranchus ocellatus]|uniref:Uncharacterized protein n=1 Tax=Plakobranchus ocellatus TaxID=259542 RepID=A0AAV4CTE1_9GAST|nr:hypothetical protein PoB_006164400 [Plakobranchus ocellatus]
MMGSGSGPMVHEANSYADTFLILWAGMKIVFGILALTSPHSAAPPLQFCYASNCYKERSVAVQFYITRSTHRFWGTTRTHLVPNARSTVRAQEIKHCLRFCGGSGSGVSPHEFANGRRVVDIKSEVLH